MAPSINRDSRVLHRKKLVAHESVPKITFSVPIAHDEDALYLRRSYS
jgi:hypothetical protein